MDDRLKVAMSAVLIAAMFVTAAGGNWLTFLFFAAMAGGHRDLGNQLNRLH